MANGISSIASMRTSNLAKTSEQVTKPEVVKMAENGGRILPPEGKPMPPQVADSVEISEAVTQINEIVRSIQRDLSFSMDEDSGRTVIRVFNSESGELIRQIPSVEVLAIAARLRDVQEDTVSQGGIEQGLLFSDST